MESDQEATLQKGTSIGGSTVPGGHHRTLSSAPNQSMNIFEYDMDNVSLTNGKKRLDPKVQLSKINLELELENSSSRENSSEDLKDWEF